MRQPTNPAPPSATAEGTPGRLDDWLIPTLATLVSAQQLGELESLRGHGLWTACVKRGWTTDEAILHALSARFRMKIANLMQVSAQALQCVTEALARRYHIVPLALTDSAVDVATCDPHDVDCERTLGFVLGREVRMALASPARIAVRLDELYRPENIIEKILDEAFLGVGDLEAIDDDKEDFEFSLGKATDRPIIRLVDRIVAKAIQRRSSDIHLEPEERGVMVRYRIDGVLQEDSVIPRALGQPLVARVKIMAQLDIADRLRPQDGRARVGVGGSRVDLRISTLPASLGEKVVIRILDSRQTVLALDGLGLHREEVTQIHALLQVREGLVIVTGPTGSGKTTTLYSIVRQIQKRGLNIVTVEDPVEVRLPGIVQVQVNEKTGLTFPAALRSILRQDPDVILVGEIRDRDTAQIAIQAGLTGHLVLTTLHTIDAASSITRLGDIGIEPYKLAAALKGVVAQRLLRRLCAQCREIADEPIPERLIAYLGDNANVHRAAGCGACSQTGYRGRLAITEVIIANADMERRIAADEPPDHLQRAARDAGMRPLWDSAVEHVVNGNTSIAELVRVLEIPAESAHRKPGARTGGRSVAIVAPLNPPAGVALDGGAFDLIDDFRPELSAPPRVLIVESEPLVRRALRELLEQHGFSVHEARDAAGALDAVDRSAPHAVILDLGPPRAGGYGLLQLLRSRAGTRATPVIVLSSEGGEDAEVRAFESGATEFLTKPFRANALVARLRAYAGDISPRSAGTPAAVPLMAVHERKKT